MSNRLHASRTCSARAKHVRDACKVSNRFQIHRRLLAAKSAVEIGANARIPSAASDLANVIDVLDKLFQFQSNGLRGGLMTNPIRNHHPRIERCADDPTALRERLDLFVVQLALMRREHAAVGMACPPPAPIKNHPFPDCLVGEMRDVENETEPIHLAQ